MTAEDLKKKIQNDMVAAMRAKEKERLGTIRLLMAAIKQREIDDQITLDNNGVLKVIEKMIKQRRDSIKQYETGNRPELAEKESKEIDILQVYMPAQMSDADINAAIDEAIQSTGASSMKDMGKVMGVLKDKLQGRADMGAVSAKIKQHLDA
ncbi:GatB/YqeY domain-containing protein [Candidiatus Paracoxiella cheracis]|uniref:GatB/YqeY domain-containing protein n=1 Tax=Candidiatus Paracoxiella cheracis TaxID=3405120 RepID=UPI003BF572AF